MGRPAKPAHRRKSATCNVRLTPALAAGVARCAKAADMDVSEWVRSLIAGAVEEAKGPRSQEPR